MGNPGYRLAVFLCARENVIASRTELNTDGLTLRLRAGEGWTIPFCVSYLFM